VFFPALQLQCQVSAPVDFDLKLFFKTHREFFAFQKSAESHLRPDLLKDFRNFFFLRDCVPIFDT
jgi:hypothetical protein